MLLSKITAWRPYRLFKIYAAWLVFSATLFILINAFSSLDEVRVYGFRTQDTVLTFAYLIFWAFLDALAVTIGMVLLAGFLLGSVAVPFAQAMHDEPPPEYRPMTANLVPDSGL